MLDFECKNEGQRQLTSRRAVLSSWDHLVVGLHHQHRGDHRFITIEGQLLGTLRIEGSSKSMCLRGCEGCDVTGKISAVNS